MIKSQITKLKKKKIADGIMGIIDFPQLSLDTEFIYSASQWRVFISVFLIISNLLNTMYIKKGNRVAIKEQR